MRTWTRLSTILATAGASLLVAACGGGSSTPDARVSDTSMGADATPPDASPPDAMVATRGMTISIGDVTVTSPGAAALGLKGAGILLEPSDLSMGGGELVYGASPVNGCVVYKYSNAPGSTTKPNPVVDEGSFTLSGTGLLKPTGTCSFVAGQGYVCIITAGAATTTTANPGGSLYTVTMTGKDFTGTDLVGSYVKLTGLAGAGWANAVPVVAQPAANTITVVNPAGTVEAAVAGVTYAFIAGAGPIPTLPGLINANANFLSDDNNRNGTAGEPAAQPVHIVKTAGTNYGAIDVSLEPAGAGFTLDPSSDKPEAFPSTPRDVVFKCATCGTKTAEFLQGVLISGRTTDVVIPAQAPGYYMPPPEAATTYHTFTCGYLFVNDLTTSAKIDMAAVAKILEDNPTRIEVRVVKASLAQPADTLNPLNGANIVVGHGFVGHTNINPAAK
jgi:hypothetical protein